MADEIKLDLLITIPLSIEPAGDMPDKWAEGLTSNAMRVHDRMLESLPFDGEYQSKLAQPANQKWNPMIAPGFVSEAGKTQANIQRAHYKGLAGGYNKFVENYEAAFATVDGVEAKRFKERVNNAKNRWAEKVSQGILRITGDKIRGRVVPQVLYWMTGDKRASKMTKHMEVLAGLPYDFTASGLRQQFRSALSSLLVTAGITILKADMDATEISDQNGRLVDLANRFSATGVKPFVVGGGATDSLLEYGFADPEFKLHARIVLV
ncbi:MAG TPA: hypothetical protein VJC37_07670 [Planctomycetota bacterium]|nr:hypothetical protein [Planctomycetota bacterium]